MRITKYRVVLSHQDYPGWSFYPVWRSRWFWTKGRADRYYSQLKESEADRYPDHHYYVERSS